MTTGKRNGTCYRQSDQVGAVGDGAAAGGDGTGAGLPALAQDWRTNNPLHRSYPPGGGTDIIACIVQERLSAALGQQIVIEARRRGGQH
jgi:tripartite-type tricarboxylate transporter receptor subunit TctC